jgi:hypothetical protein
VYWNKKDKQYLAKINANFLARKTPYFRRTLAINHKVTNIQIIKLTKQDNLLEKIGGFSSIDNNLCFMVQHIKHFDTFLFNMSIDIVVTDIHHRVVKILPNVLPDSIPHFPKEAHNA